MANALHPYFLSSRPVNNYSMAAVPFFRPLLLLLLSAGSLAAGGCQTSRKAANAEGGTESACADAWTGAPNAPRVGWQRVSLDKEATPAGIVLPAAYEAYRAAPDALKALFTHIRDGKEAAPAVFVLPLPTGCAAFNARRSAAVSDELQRRYPDLIAIQGTGIDDKGADLRLEWDGKAMHGQVIRGGTVYLITPVTSGDGVVYLVYDKAKSGEVKKPFESPTRKMQYDR